MKALGWFAGALLAAGVGPAMAQAQSVSYSTWVVADHMITLKFVLPFTEAQRLMGVDVPVLTVSRLKDYVLSHFSVHSASGNCPALDQGYDLGRVDPLEVGAGLYGFEVFYKCADMRGVTLRNTALFDRAPGHVNFARIEESGRVAEHVFTAEHQQFLMPDTGELPTSGPTSYIHLGAEYIMRSADRLLLVLALALLVKRRRDVAYTALALVLGYGLSLAVSATNWVAPRLTLLEVFIGLLVATLGTAVALRETERRSIVATAWGALLGVAVIAAAWLQGAAAAALLLGVAAFSAGFFLVARRFEGRHALWPLLAALFGFLDGWVWPTLLAPSEWSRQAQVRMVIGWDVGAVLIEALVLVTLAGGFLLLRSRGLTLARRLVCDLSATALCGFGSFWLFTRLGM